MTKKFDHKDLSNLLVTVTLLDDDRDFIVETLGGLSGNLLKRLQASQKDEEQCVKFSLTLLELRQIINGLFTVALYNEDAEEEANRIAERLLVCEYEILEAQKINN